MAAVDLAPLRSQLDGDALGPDDGGWDAARSAWNLQADLRPTAVVLAEGAGDVRATVEFARQNGLRVTAQGTGHAATALEPLEGTVLVKTGPMSRVEIDPGARSARVEGGALSGDVCAAAGEHGLAPLSGSSPDVGMVGFTLGGGLGWLGRRYGLAANCVTAAEIVTADGELVRADHESHTDLFWALRGAGGSLGVVTALELELQPLAELYAGGIAFPAAMGEELLHVYREWAQTVPDEMSSGIRYLTPPPIPEVPEPIRGVPLVDVTIAYAGDPAEGQALVEPLRAVGEPVMDACATVPAAALCRIYGDPEQPVPGLGHAAVLSQLTPEAVGELVALAGPGSDSPLLMVALRHLGGALGSAPAGAGAAGALDGEYTINAIGLPMAPEHVEPIDAHLDRLMDGMAAWETGLSYMNFADRPADASTCYDAETYRRLLEVKQQVDPDDLFQGNHPVR
jgi:FAD/FMN-containing dehydrogenase